MFFKFFRGLRSSERLSTNQEVGSFESLRARQLVKVRFGQMGDLWSGRNELSPCYRKSAECFPSDRRAGRLGFQRLVGF